MEIGNWFFLISKHQFPLLISNFQATNFHIFGSKFMKKYLTALILSLIIGILLSLLFSLGFFISWQNKLTDKLFLQGKPNENIIIIAIDNKSLQELGRWPWERDVHADLINKISEQKPIIIGFDVNFPEESSAKIDSVLAKAIKDAGNVILPIEAELVIQKDEITASSILSPIPEVAGPALDLGLTNTPPDSDGVFRKLPLVVYGEDEQEYSAFAQVIAQLFLVEKQFYLPEIPTDAQNRMFINYLGKPKTFSFISAIDVIEEKVEPDLFQDKIVLVGATAPDLHDEQIAPVSDGEPMSGVEIHANAINTILTNKFLTPLPKLNQLAIFIIAAILVSLLVTNFRAVVSSIATLVILAVYIITALVIFDRGLILDLFYFILIIFLTYLVAVVWRYITEAREKRQIKNTFSRYVSPEIIAEILADPKKLKLGGDKKELSILFSDIRGFTAISEKLSPEQLVQLLNEYLGAMTDLIMDSGGVVDKYIGDAIMAFWGAPIKQPNHPELICQTALEMTTVLNKERARWQRKFGVELRVGIGIHTGEAVIGNMGSSKRFDYTIMGDNVNLASRLEGITKQYGAQIIASQSIKNKVEDKFVFRYLDKVAVKGKTQGVEIYELVGVKPLDNNGTQELMSSFAKGVELYKNQKWDEAIEFFQDLSGKYPEDGPIKLYLERCEELKNNPPAEDWDGVYRLTTK